MIISASYKTDIPAFYGEWFINRLRAGFCRMVNPFNKRASRVSLARSAVDGFVFWTKNAGPFLPHLKTVADLGYPFVVQYTINGYPRELESRVIDAGRSVEHVREISRDYGRDAVVWRYDPIVMSSLTPLDLHLTRFREFAARLEGSVDEVVISFVQVYRKTLRNLQHASTKHGFSWEEPSAELRSDLVQQLLDCAREHGMTLSICSQPENLILGAQAARCIDAARLERISGKAFRSVIKGNRPGCECYQSRDIGDYNTCPQGCVYCYAVESWDLAKKRYANHDPMSEFLDRDMEKLAKDEAPVGQLPLLEDH